jgi:ribA/ribD-fused uncharacterized protein
MSHGLDTDETIYFYEQEFYPLSNFSAFTLRWRGYRLDTAEAAYHWEKFPPDARRRLIGRESPLQEAIRLAPSAHEAFKLGQAKDGRRGDWDDVKIDVMRRILRAKVDQHTYVRHKLLETGDRQLIENSWRDTFWGWGPDRDGQNMLGKLWMEIRASLRADTQESRPSLLLATAGPDVSLRADTQESRPSLLLATAGPAAQRPSTVLAAMTAPRDPERTPERLPCPDPASPPAAKTTTTTRQGVRDLGGNTRPRRTCPRSSTGRHHAGPRVVVGKTWAFDPLVGDYLTDEYGRKCVWCGEVLL